MPDIPEDLREALSLVLANAPVDRLTAAVERLIEAYRSGRPPTSPIVADRLDAAAYAAYRMPATFAAVSAALNELGRAAPAFAPETVLDLGGGTGAASWAVAARFPGVRAITVADQSAEALAIGRSLARHASAEAMRNASWLRDTGFRTALPAADLVIVSYVLGELASDAQHEVVDRAAALGGAVLVVEPGTPAGHARILAARDRLITAGLRLAAPCPHSGSCPIAEPDWCHFAARVNRTSLHRRVKSAALGYEDEKFTYVVGVPAVAVAHSPARVLRRPAQRKGLVTLRLCHPDGAAAQRIVTKRHGAQVYRAARDVQWGEGFLV